MSETQVAQRGPQLWAARLLAVGLVIAILSLVAFVALQFLPERWAETMLRAANACLAVGLLTAMIAGAVVGLLGRRGAE